MCVCDGGECMCLCMGRSVWVIEECVCDREEFVCGGMWRSGAGEGKKCVKKCSNEITNQLGLHSF